MGVLLVDVDGDWVQVGCGTGDAPGRLELTDGAGWIREACDGETGHPVFALVDRAWVQVACMVPMAAVALSPVLVGSLSADVIQTNADIHATRVGSFSGDVLITGGD